MLIIVRAWILLSALLCASGWILSAVHQLNRTGYGVVFALALLGVGYWWQTAKQSGRKGVARAWHKSWHRFRKPAPLLFLTLAMMSLVAGAFYAPVNGDTLSYRLPRVLDWLGAEGWHWIRTLDPRMNQAGCGYEWMSAPLVLFGRDDRWFFLINVISFLLLPGLVFSVFTRLGVLSRVAWWWMWLLPSGWCYALQAGGVINDMFTVIYALAAIDFALRARETKQVSDLWLSLLAAGLLTGAKQTAIPLALLWGIAAWPSRRWLLVRPVATTLVVCLSLLVSALPISVANVRYYGGWMGPTQGCELHSALWGIIGNAFCLPAQNLVPPLFPWSTAWNGAMQRFLQTPFGSHFASFEIFGYLGRAVNESSAGIGLGICVLGAISLGATWFRRPAGRGVEACARDRLLWLLRLVPWILLVLFMAKVGTWANARQLCPYYVFFFPLLLARPGQAWLVRRLWWQRFGLLVMLLTAVMLVVSRERPLFPANAVLGRLQAQYPDSKIISAISKSFAFGSSTETRRDLFRAHLPAEERVVGYATTHGVAEPGLLLPLGPRRVERILPGDTPEEARLRGIHYVVLDDSGLQAAANTLEQWLRRYDGELVDQSIVLMRPDLPADGLYLVRLHSK
jgi:hypothetical protein